MIYDIKTATTKHDRDVHDNCDDDYYDGGLGDILTGVDQCSTGAKNQAGNLSGFVRQVFQR